MEKTKPYPYFKFVSGVCSMIAGVFAMAMGYKGAIGFTVLGFVFFGFGTLMFYIVSKAAPK